MESCCIQILSRNVTVNREQIERFGKEIKENKRNVWSITPEKHVDRLYMKRKDGRTRSDECGMLR